MLTIEDLNKYGANTSEGLGRCMNNEAFYLRVVDMALKDANFDKLTSAVEGNNKKEAFEAAHALKGTLGNVALTPLFEVTSEMTEMLRRGEEADYQAYLEKILSQRNDLLKLQDQ